MIWTAFSFILKHKRMVGFGLAVMGVIGAFMFYGMQKHGEGFRKAEAACEREKQEAIIENIETRKIQDNVGRLDDVPLADSLREDSF